MDNNYSYRVQQGGPNLGYPASMDYYHQVPHPQTRRVYETEYPYWDAWDIRLNKARALCRFLWPSAQHSQTVVEDMKAGGRNKIISVRIVYETGYSGDYIIRMPFDEHTILSTVAALRHLRRYAELRVPGVVFFDNTRQNPFGYGYIVLRRIHGVSLQSCFHSLTKAQKLALARELGDFYTRLRSITNPTAGTLKASLPCRSPRPMRIQNPEIMFIVEPFGVDLSGYDDEVDYNIVDNGFLPHHQLKNDPPDLSVVNMVLAPFNRRLYQCVRNEVLNAVAGNAYDVCNDIIEELVETPPFKDYGDADFCLWHADLSPRKIMVDFNSTPIITGVLDWDVSVFAPRFFASTPPMWLWRHHVENREVSFHTKNGVFKVRNSEADTPDNQEIKEAFEEAVGPEWVAQAYQPEFVFVRRLLRLSQKYLGCLEELWWTDLEETKKEWEAYLVKDAHVMEMDPRLTYL